MILPASHAAFSRRSALRLVACALAAPAVSLFSSVLLSLDAALPPLPPQDGGTSGIPPGSILEPNQLAEMLSHPAAPGKSGAGKPAVICVGFRFLYNAAHIPGALYLGPGREGSGIVSLAKWAGNKPNTQLVVLYCGCCPWTQCPNIAPAYTALKNLAFSQVKVLRIDRNFGADWVDKGLPTQKPPHK